MSFKKLYLEPTDPEALRRWGPLLLLSLLILAGGISWALAIGNDANKLDHRLGHLKEAVSDMRAYVNLEEQKKH